MSLFTPSGGLVYHWRAVRYREGLWAPFREAIAAWLMERLPPSDELILVGPSAGHCLPIALFRTFRRLVVIEPDPIARRWLSLRLGPARTEVEPRDLLVTPLLSGKSGLDNVLERRPAAAVLFCNLLGQLQLALSEAQQLQFQSEFRRRIVPRLDGRHWASFHDRWSLDRDAGEPGVPQLRFQQLPSDDALGVACFGAAGAPLTVLDHGTSQLFPPAWPRDYFAWQLTPQALHIVEAVAGA